MSIRGSMIWLLIFAPLMAPSNASAATQTLDAVVASVGNLAITVSDVEREYRLERLLEAQWPFPPPSATALDAARQRLTEQVLLTREENPVPADESTSKKMAAEGLAALRKQFAQPASFQRALNDLGMTESEVLAGITQQELMLRLIDQRLRPAASPSEDEVADYYRSTFVPEFRSKNGSAAAPPLPAVANQIQEILIQKRINELLDRWIEELKPTADVRFHPFPVFNAR